MALDPGLIGQVTKIAEKVLKKPIPDVNKNLFDAGFADSLTAVNLLVAIEDQLGISLDLLEFAEREEFTLRNISRIVAETKQKTEQPSAH
jgi:acyl carrier protein